MSYVGSFQFTVEPFQDDASGRLSWFFLGNHILRVANWHAVSHGFGYEHTQSQSHTWVLSRLVVEMDEMPRTGETYVIKTWVSRVYRQFTDRMFSIESPDGKVYGSVSSIWALIDVNTRQPADLEKLPNGGFAYAIVDTPSTIAPLRRVRMTSEEVALTVPTLFSDLDINGHLNSIRYIQHALNVFPPERHAKQAVRRMEIAYCLETLYGEDLALYVQENDANDYSIDMKKNGDTVVAKVRVTFNPQAL